ncbi:major facilitator superfamily domain-containing protein 9-like isoform X3 [Acanthaster planci]|nr:major facilitator superfamily domain-containing protein 9-like isoform X3 [Acanthaster planci]
MLVPLLPRHARNLGASPILVGAVGSVYGFLQLVSGPVMGRLSDMMGRRLVLLACLFMTMVGYTINIFATSLTVLICARVPLGIFKHGIATVKAYLAEITPKQERPLVFGRFNAASSFGFIIGPLCGGYLSEYEGGFYQVATCTAIVFAINVLFVYFLVHPKKQDSIEKSKSVAAFTQEEYSIRTNFFHSFKTILGSCGDLLLLQLLMSSGVMLYRSNFVLILEDRFQARPSVTGQLMSFSALVAVVSGMLVGRVVSFYSSISKLLLHSSVLLCFTLFGLTYAPTFFVVVVFTALLSMENAISKVCLTDLSVRRSSLDNTGALLGISQSVLSVTRSFAPFISGFMLEFGPYAPGLTGVCCAAISSLFIIIFPPERATIASEKKSD